SRQVRLIEVEGIISPFCGLGADAHVLADYNWVKQHLGATPFKRFSSGPPGYAIAGVGRTLPSLLFQRMTHCRVTNAGGEAYRVGAHGSVGRPVPVGEVLYEGPMRVCALSTIPYYGYGFRMFPYAEDRPDRMQLRLSTIKPLEFLFRLKDIWRGDYENPEYLFD